MSELSYLLPLNHEDCKKYFDGIEGACEIHNWLANPNLVSAKTGIYVVLDTKSGYWKHGFSRNVGERVASNKEVLKKLMPKALEYSRVRLMFLRISSVMAPAVLNQLRESHANDPKCVSSSPKALKDARRRPSSMQRQLANAPLADDYYIENYFKPLGISKAYCLDPMSPVLPTDCKSVIGVIFDRAGKYAFTVVTSVWRNWASARRTQFKQRGYKPGDLYMVIAEYSYTKDVNARLFLLNQINELEPERRLVRQGIGKDSDKVINLAPVKLPKPVDPVLPSEVSKDTIIINGSQGQRVFIRKWTGNPKESK